MSFINQSTALILIWLKLCQLSSFPLQSALVKCRFSSGSTWIPKTVHLQISIHENTSFPALLPHQTCSKTLYQLHMRRWLRFAGTYDWYNKGHHNGYIYALIVYGCKSLVEIGLHISRNTAKKKKAWFLGITLHV